MTGSRDLINNKLFVISGYVKLIFNDDKMIYLSCPDCRKKVIEVGEQLWRCENCSKVIAKNKPTYMLSAIIQDSTG